MTNDIVFNLYFQDACGDERLVKADLREDEVCSTITEYVHTLNPNYKIYYTRFWLSDAGDTIYDVGSHTEFFILKKE